MNQQTQEPMVTVTFTFGEAAALRQLLHFAVQARGLEVAEVAIQLNKKIEDAAEAANPSSPLRRAGNGTMRAQE